jgi:hypothetical protein
VRQWLSVGAWCLLYQVAHSLRQDATRAERWTSLLSRFHRNMMHGNVWKRLITNFGGILAADVAPRLVDIAGRLDIEELESMVSIRDVRRSQDLTNY